MTRAIPRRLGRVPVDEAAHVRAVRRQLSHRALVVSIDGDFFAIELENLSVAARDGSRRLAFRAGKAIADPVVRIVRVLAEVVPQTLRDARAVDVEELRPRVLHADGGVAGHHRADGAERDAVAGEP